MNKRPSLLAFPAVCLAVLLTLIACGGSGGRNTTPPPATLSEAVAAVRDAVTPAQGQFAYSQVNSYLGVSTDSNFVDLSETDKAGLAENMGASIAQDNVNPLPGATYGAALASYATALAVSVTPTTALGQLNSDLAAAQTILPTPSREELLLIAALDGGAATLDKRVSVAAAYALARWFAGQYGIVAAPLTRGACQDACLATYDREAAGALYFYESSRAIMIFLYEIGYRRLEETAWIILNLLASYEGKLMVFRAQYDTCIVHCHEQ